MYCGKTKRIVTGEPVCFSDGAPFRTQREEVAGRIVDGLNALAAACGELEREAAEKGALEVILNNDSWETDEDYLKLVLADYTEQVLEYQSEHPGLLVPKND